MCDRDARSIGAAGWPGKPRHALGLSALDTSVAAHRQTGGYGLSDGNHLATRLSLLHCGESNASVG